MSAEPDPEPERRSHRPGWVDRLGLTRSTTDRVIAGVAGGIAERLGVDPVVVRLAFVVLALAGGVGAVLYLVIWLIAPERAPQPAPAADRGTLPVRILAIVLVALGSLLVLRDLGLWLGDGLVWPVAIAAFGSAVIWARGEGAGP